MKPHQACLHCIQLPAAPGSRGSVPELTRPAEKKPPLLASRRHGTGLYGPSGAFACAPGYITAQCAALIAQAPAPGAGLNVRQS